MSQASLFGFTRSALWRLGAAGLYAVAAVSVVVLVQTRLGQHETSALERPPAPATARASLTLTATYAVETWTVQCQGRDLPRRSASAQEWHGDLPVSAGTADLFVHAEPHDPLASGPCALRATVTTASGASSTQVVWGEGAIAAPITLAVAGSGAAP